MIDDADDVWACSLYQALRQKVHRDLKAGHVGISLLNLLTKAMTPCERCLGKTMP